jgi:hypothetical protein
MDKEWMTSKSHIYFLNIIQQVWEIQKDRRRDAKINFQFNQNLAKISNNNNISVSKYSIFGAGTSNKMI